MNDTNTITALANLVVLHTVGAVLGLVLAFAVAWVIVRPTRSVETGPTLADLGAARLAMIRAEIDAERMPDRGAPMAGYTPVMHTGQGTVYAPVR